MQKKHIGVTGLQRQMKKLRRSCSIPVSKFLGTFTQFAVNSDLLPSQPAFETMLLFRVLGSRGNAKGKMLKVITNFKPCFYERTLHYS